MKEAKISKISPLDFPKNILERLNLDQLFKKSAQYYLECWDKLEEYKNEKLIKPLHKESIVYIEELKNILYALVSNKELEGEPLRVVFLNFLSFQESKTNPLKTFYKSLAEKYIGKLRNTFYNVSKEGEKLSDKTYEITLSEDKVIGVSIKSVIKDIGDNMVHWSSKEEFNIQEMFLKIKGELIERYITHLNQLRLIEQINELVTSLKEEVLFTYLKLEKILKEEEVSSLTMVKFKLKKIFERFLNKVFQDIVQRITSIKPPFFLHVLIYREINTGLKEILLQCENSFIEPIFKRNLLKLNGIMMWKFEVFNFKEITLRFKECIAKSSQINEKTLKKLSELERANYEVFEMNFEREIQQQAKTIIHSLLLSFLNWLDDLESLKISEEEHRMLLTVYIQHFWKLTTDLIRHGSFHLTEDIILEDIIELVLKFESEDAENTITKVKLLTLLKSKSFASFICDLRELKSFKSSLCMELLRFKLVSEMKATHFLKPLEDSLTGRLTENISSEVFPEIKKMCKFRNSEMNICIVSALRSTSNQILKVRIV